MHPLDGPRRKLDRAAEHIKTLNYAVSRWFDSNPLRVVAQHFDMDQTNYIYLFEFPAVPILFGIVAGDIFHNLRSALDHLVWQLALKNTSTPSPITAFPICIKNNGDTSRHMNRLLKDVSDDARQVIESLQPYNTTYLRKPEHHGLWMLDQLSNFDKHRIITLNAGIAEIKFRAGMTQRWLNDYTIEITVPVVDKNLPPPPPKMSFYLVLGHDIIANGLRLAAIPELHKLISGGILPQFDRFFL
jgi:hypothetical protein